MPPLPKRHHFVPQFLIRNFVGADGLARYFDRERHAEGIVRRNPDKVFYRKHLYTVFEKDGSKDVSQELAFGQLEDAVAPVVRKIIAAARDGALPRLQLDEKLTWDAFLYDQWRRVPDLRTELFTPSMIEGMKADIIAELEQKFRPLTDEEHAQLDEPAAIARIHQYAMVASLGRRSENALKIMASRGLAVLRLSKPNKSFVLGSRPVVKITASEHTHLSHPTVEFWLPIAPDVAAGIGQASHDEMIIVPPDSWVRDFNIAIIRQSTQVVARSETHLQSLLSRR